MASFTGANGATELSAVAKRGDLRARILSAVVLGPLVLAAIVIDGLVFGCLIFAMALLCMREWVRIVSPRDRELVKELSYGFVLAGLITQSIIGPLPSLAVLVGLTSILLIVAALYRYRHRRLIAFGIPYIGLAAVALLWLRDQPDIGLALLLWLALSVWATDIGGYVAGRSIGGAKLAPRISPNKTWAGFFGGMAAAALFGGLVALAFSAERPALASLLAAVLAVIAQLGDLFESAVKRRFGVKDSGTLIPGHGGLLDRVDGLIAAAPVAALYHATLGASFEWW